MYTCVQMRLKMKIWKCVHFMFVMLIKWWENRLALFSYMPFISTDFCWLVVYKRLELCIRGKFKCGGKCFASFICNWVTPMTLSAAEKQLGLLLAPGLTVHSTLQATNQSNTLPWSHMWHAAAALGSHWSCCSLSHTLVIIFSILWRADVIN